MRKACMALAFAVGCSFSSCVWTQESTAVLGTVVVTASKESALPATAVLTSVDLMGSDQVEDKNVKNSWELLGQMPGISLKSWQMGLESGKAALRGFNGEGYVNGVKLLIDGVPANTNSGNMRQLDMIFPMDIDYIEVVRGTNDPRYGLHSIGGNINVATKQGGNYSDARLSQGSWNTTDFQGVFGRETEEFSQNYFLAVYKSDGFRDHSNTEKYGAGAKWFYLPTGSDLKLGLIVRSFDGTADETGYLTQAEYNASPLQHISTRSGANTDSRQMQNVSAHLDYAISSSTHLSTKIYYSSLTDDRKMTYPGVTYSVGSQNRNWNEDHQGILTTLTSDTNERLTLEAGLNVEKQNNQYQRHYWASGSAYAGSVSTCTTSRSGTTRYSECWDYTVENTGAYLQAIFRPLENLKIIPAWRVDHFTGSTYGHLRTTSSYLSQDMTDYGWINQPKLSVVYNLNPLNSVYVNWGQTFQLLTGGAISSGSYGSSLSSASVNTGEELGFKFNNSTGLDGRIAVWQQDAPDEIANLASAGTFQWLGSTRRRGFDLQITSQFSRSTKVWLSHSVQEAKIISGYTSSLTGKHIFGTPDQMSTLGLEHAVDEKLQISSKGRSQGGYYINPLNSNGKFGEYVLFDASAKYQATKNLSVDFQVRNVFDKVYASDVWDEDPNVSTGNAFYSAGAPRSCFVSATIKF